MTDITRELRQDARGFRERARQVRPHPRNPHKVKAADVARFVDVSCAYIAQEVDDAADTIQSLTAKLERAEGHLRYAVKRLTVQADEVGDAKQLKINCDKGLILVEMALAALKDIEDDR